LLLSASENVQDVVMRYLLKRFPWQVKIEDLLERSKHMVITEEMIQSLRSPPTERTAPPVTTPTRVLKELRNLR
jgi:hypothetical protein